jgi:hydrogenase maturation protein HypF
VRDVACYHGQAALELEQVADPDQRAGYRAGISATKPFVIRSTDLIRAVVADLRSGVEVPTIAARFHAGVAGAIADACERTRAAWGLDTVALSGEIFQNALLVERTVTRLEAEGFRVLTHVRVPPNDGGISFGQVVVAGAHARDANALDHRG